MCVYIYITYVFLTHKHNYTYIHIYYTMDYSLLSHKKNEIMSFAITWMELETLILSKVSRTKTNDIIYMWNLKKKKDTRQKQTYRHRKQIYGYQRGKVRIRMDWEFGINIYTLLYIKQITNKDLLYSTGNYSQYFLIT